METRFDPQVQLCPFEKNHLKATKRKTQLP